LRSTRNFARDTRARERQADVLAGQILEISDDGTNDYVQTEDGEVPNHEHIQRSRLRVDSRKWLASKLAPKKYGDKIDATPSGTPFHAPAFAARLAGDIVPDLDVWFPRKLAFLREPHRYKVLYGGRGGIKS